jgi:hypothetical protein
MKELVEWEWEVIELSNQLSWFGLLKGAITKMRGSADTRSVTGGQSLKNFNTRLFYFAVNTKINWRVLKQKALRKGIGVMPASHNSTKWICVFSLFSQTKSIS